MVEEYQAPKVINRLTTWLTRLGVGRSETMTTTGRKSGQPREVPVSPIEIDGEEYIVAPYGEVSWVHNVRADPVVTLRSGRRARKCRLVEVTDEAAQVVKSYWDRERFPRKYMDVPGEGAVEDFAGVSGRFPVFRVDAER
jgi:deazaflavin-dependent oxidoreductase (nitroreductase family)